MNDLVTVHQIAENMMHFAVLDVFNIWIFFWILFNGNMKSIVWYDDIKLISGEIDLVLLNWLKW